MKIYAIKITDHAAQQLENIVRYIALDLNSPETAVRLYRRIRSRIESLSRLPQRHRTFFKMYRRIRVDLYSILSGALCGSYEGSSDISVFYKSDSVRNA